MVVESGHIEAATILLGHPSIDVNRRDADETALHKAIKNGNLEILQALLRHPNIDVNAKCSKGYTSLQRLLRRKHWNLIEDPLCHKLAQFLFLHEKLDRGDPVSIELSEKYGPWLIFELLLDREPPNPLRY